jgi:ribonuclease BN (tRNA processing enzyme)
MELDAAARGSKATLASVIRSLEENPPTVRVHVAPENLADVQYQTRRFRDHGFIEYMPLESRDQLPGGGALTAFEVHHRVDESCYGFRLDWPGRSLAYVSDTYGEPGVPYLQHMRGADVLLHECYMPDDDEPELARQIGHSHITPVVHLAAEAEVGRLVLVHLSAVRPGALESRLERAHAIFPRTEVAFDGMEIEF